MRYFLFLLAWGFFVSSAFAGSFGSVVDRVAQSKLVLFGEAHDNPLHSSYFESLLSEFEEEYPGKIGVVGLEVFRDLQPHIDRYLQSGDPNDLLSSKDDEVLRGYKQSQVIKKNFLSIYQRIYEINQNRPPGNKIRAVALDIKPDPTMTLKEWMQTHSRIEAANWALARDHAMLKRLETFLPASSSQIGFVFIGSAHLQEVGGIDVKVGPWSKKVEWLGARVNRVYSDVLTIYPNVAAGPCKDKIEKELDSRGVRSVSLVDLSTSPLGEMDNFQCDNGGFPAPSQVEFFPANYKAKSHFDWYLCFPRSL